MTALEQARLGRGICAPNPSVGAIAVQNNTIIARAWHHGVGSPHAEQLLITQFPEQSPNVTLYVTLEPCNHWGRTPPCVEAIIKHGIERVVYAFKDPNPVVSSNNTPDLLRAHGIDVLYYPLHEIDQFYESYYHWTLTKKPWLTVKIAQTFDGKIAGEYGERVHLSNDVCNDFTHTKRLAADVILTTSRTINQDDPLLNARVSGVCNAKDVAILDARLTLNLQSKVLKMARHCHIYHDAALRPADNWPNCTFHAMPMVSDKFDLAAIVCHLGSLGYHDVWVEAGGGLFSALHQAHLVNRTHLYLVPKIIGDAGITAYRNNEVLRQPRSIQWHAMGDNMMVTFDW